MNFFKKFRWNFIVPKKIVFILNGLLYFPGEKISKWKWFWVSEWDAFLPNISTKARTKVECQDQTIEVSLETLVTLDINTAKRNNQRSFDLETFKASLKDTLIKAAQAEGKKKQASQLISGPFQLLMSQYIVDGFPIVWDGMIKVSWIRKPQERFEIPVSTLVELYRDHAHVEPIIFRVDSVFGANLTNQDGGDILLMSNCLYKTPVQAQNAMLYLRSKIFMLINRSGNRNDPEKGIRASQSALEVLIGCALDRYVVIKFD